MINTSMVAVCDILGFGSLVKRMPYSDLKGHIFTIVNLLTAASIPPAQKHSNRFRVAHSFFSDTVLMYSLSDDKHGYQDLLTIVTYLIATPILYPEYRFRAGISYGEFYHDPDNNVYAGKALVDAHELEEMQDWCGGALTKDAENEIIKTNVDRTYLTRYDVPMKNGNTESHLVINWTQADHKDIDQEYGWITRPDDLSLTDEEMKKVENKLINMERFHLDKCVKCKAYRATSKKN